MMKRNPFCIKPDIFIHSCYFYNASSSPLLLGGAPDTAWILCRSFTPKCTGNCERRTCPYMAARVGVEPTTLQTIGIDSTNEPPHPTMYMPKLRHAPP